MKNKSSIFIMILLVIGLGVGVFAVKQSTENRQHASQFIDLNSAIYITQSNNPDGTMGPASYLGNYSNSLPAEYLGSLDFQITDPTQGKRPTDIPPVITTHSLPTQAQGNDNQGGPQSITALTLTITKVEVHLAHLGIPGTKNETGPTEIHGKPSSTPTQKSNQDVDKWETLNIGGVQTIDLMQLAKTKSFSSLGFTKLANGRYTEVRLYVSMATATLTDGTKVTLTIPGKANIVRVVEPFVIDSSKTTTLTMDFDAQNSVIKAGDAYLLKPVVAHFNQQNQQ